MRSREGFALGCLAACVIGCGGGGGASTDPPDPPDDQKPRLRGRVVEEGSTFGIGAVQIRFDNASGSQVSSLTTDANGNFAGDVPLTATSFRITSIPLGYHRSYTYASQRYSPLIATCVAPLPSLATGGVMLSPISIPSSSFPPPPPPDGCR